MVAIRVEDDEGGCDVGADLFSLFFLFRDKTGASEGGGRKMSTRSWKRPSFTSTRARRCKGPAANILVPKSRRHSDLMSEKARAARCMIKGLFLQPHVFPLTEYPPTKSTSLQPENHEYRYRNRNTLPHSSPQRHLVGTKPRGRSVLQVPNAHPGYGRVEEAYCQGSEGCLPSNPLIPHWPDEVVTLHFVFRPTPIPAFSDSCSQTSRSPGCLCIHASSNWGRIGRMRYFWTLDVAVRISSFSGFTLITD